jgi:hypothetical protein
MKRAYWMAAAVLAGAAGAADDPATVDRAALEKWVETRRLESREKQDWRVGREILEGRIDLVRREADTFRQQTAQATNDMGDVDKKLAELRAGNAELAAVTAGLGDSIAKLEAGTLAMLGRSPVLLRERVKPLSQRVPKDPAQSKMTLSERFQNVVGILNEVNKFAREVHIASEVRDLQDGAKAEVSVFYIGLAQAYYCNEAGGVAGVGRPGDADWVWEPDNDLVGAVAGAIGVHRNEKPADYVRLPVTVK